MESPQILIAPATLHTPEPWLASPYRGMIVGCQPAPGTDPRHFHSEEGGWIVGESMSEHDRRRILACVNACAGISTKDLEAIYQGPTHTLERLARKAAARSKQIWKERYPDVRENDPPLF